MSGLLVFSHANGFPAGTYRVLFDAWRAAGLSVEAVEKFGHDSAYAIGSNWPRLRDQLIDFVEGCGEPAFLVGHSLGGYLSLLAACRRPELARCVVMLDSPIVSGWRAHSVQVAKATGLIHRVSPGRVSRRRRERWPSREAARAHFAAKHAFALWDVRVLDDYIAAGLEASGNEVALAFRRDIETRLYDTLPHHLPEVLKRHPPQVPVAFIGGTRSAEVRQVGLAATRAVTRGRLAWIDGTHLFPMEQPESTAAEVLRVVSELCG